MTSWLHTCGSFPLRLLLCCSLLALGGGSPGAGECRLAGATSISHEHVVGILELLGTSLFATSAPVLSILFALYPGVGGGLLLPEMFHRGEVFQ